jgi:hypothetical protein
MELTRFTGRPQSFFDCGVEEAAGAAGELPPLPASVEEAPDGAAAGLSALAPFL